MDDVEEIKKLKARYFRYLDTKDWAGYRSIFTEDVVFDMSDPGDEIRYGIEDVMKYVEALALERSVHHGHMPEIDITSETTATGIWSMEDHNVWTDGSPSHHGYGHYIETYEKSDDRWRIKTMKLSYLRIDFMERTILRPAGKPLPY